MIARQESRGSVGPTLPPHPALRTCSLLLSFIRGMAKAIKAMKAMKVMAWTWTRTRRQRAKQISLTLQLLAKVVQSHRDHLRLCALLRIIHGRELHQFSFIKPKHLARAVRHPRHPRHQPLSLGRGWSFVYNNELGCSEYHYQGLRPVNGRLAEGKYRIQHLYYTGSSFQRSSGGTPLQKWLGQQSEALLDEDPTERYLRVKLGLLGVTLMPESYDWHLTWRSGYVARTRSGIWQSGWDVGCLTYRLSGVWDVRCLSIPEAFRKVTMVLSPSARP